MSDEIRLSQVSVAQLEDLLNRNPFAILGRICPKMRRTNMSVNLDVDWVRAQFPAFEVPALQGKAFFENAGGSFTSRFVIDRLTRFYTERKVQPYAGYEASSLGGAEMDEARSRLAAMMGVEPHRMNFGPSTSQNTYVLAQAFRERVARWLSRGRGRGAR